MGILTAASAVATVGISQSPGHAHHTIKAGMVTGLLLLLTGAAGYMSKYYHKNMSDTRDKRNELERNIKDNPYIPQNIADNPNLENAAKEIQKIEIIVAQLIPGQKQTEKQKSNALMGAMLTMRRNYLSHETHREFIKGFMDFHKMKETPWKNYIDGSTATEL